MSAAGLQASPWQGRSAATLLDPRVVWDPGGAYSAAVPAGESVQTLPFSDGELALAISRSPNASRSEEAELARRFAPRLRLFGLRHLGDEAAAADLTQRALLTMLEKLRSGEVRQTDRIGSFVLGVARMHMLEMRRKRDRERPSVPSTADEATVPAAEPLPRERLRECLEGLGQREASVVLMSFYEERTAAEIAEHTGLSQGNVRVLRHRAIGLLRDCMGLDKAGR